MTRRERTLLTALGVLVGTAALLFGYAEYRRRDLELDARIAKAERRLAAARMPTGRLGAPVRDRRPWSAAEIDREDFLVPLASLVRASGWTLRTTTRRGGRDGEASYLVSAEGPAERWLALLAALEGWDRPVRLVSFDARISGKETMNVEMELAYEAR